MSIRDLMQSRQTRMSPGFAILSSEVPSTVKAYCHSAGASGAAGTTSYNELSPALMSCQIPALTMPMIGTDARGDLASGVTTPPLPVNNHSIGTLNFLA